MNSALFFFFGNVSEFDSSLCFCNKWNWLFFLFKIAWNSKRNETVLFTTFASLQILRVQLPKTEWSLAAHSPIRLSFAHTCLRGATIPNRSLFLIFFNAMEYTHATHSTINLLMMWSLQNNFIPFYVWLFGIQQKSKMGERKKIRIENYELKFKHQMNWQREKERERERAKEGKRWII